MNPSHPGASRLRTGSRVGGRRTASLAALLAALLPAGASADRGFKWGVETTLTTEFDSNVFNLDDRSQERVEDRDPVDQANGRIRDMESVYDFVLSPELELTASWKTPAGRLSIRPRGAYHRHLLNPARSFPEFGLEIRQELPKHSALGLDFEYELDVFKKNYLQDAAGTGEVSSDELIYRPGIHDDWALEARYERRLWRGGSEASRFWWVPRSVAELEVGYGQRRFEGFPNRDLDIAGGGLTLANRFARRLELEVSYQFAHVGAPGDEELSVIDEPEVGTDLNGDFDLVDSNVATFASVDRTRWEHAVELKLKTRVLRRVGVWTSYRYRLKDFQSQEPLDIRYRGRTDDVHTVESGMKWKFHEHWAFTVEADLDWRSSNKPAGLLGDEDADKFGFSNRFAISSEF